MITIETKEARIQLKREGETVKVYFPSRDGFPEIIVEMRSDLAIKLGESLLEVCCPPPTFRPKPYQVVKDGKIVFEGKEV